jgi:outer membrane protein
MNFKHLVLMLITLVAVCALTGSGFAQKIGYIHSQKILAEFKDAKDAQQKTDELNQQWQKEGLEMQKQLQEMQDSFDSQSLLLSESKKAEKAQEIQTLYLKLQQFQQQKWQPGSGEIFAKEKEFMEPVLEKINIVIKKVGDAEGYDYIFDTASGNILYASDKMPDLTDKVLAELEKGSSSTTTK